MSALVCGKRNTFEDHSAPGPTSPSHTPKRARVRTNSSPSRGGFPGDKLTALSGLFPGMNTQDLHRALAECGDDLDLAIRRLNLLHLASSSEAAAQQTQSNHSSPGERTDLLGHTRGRPGGSSDGPSVPEGCGKQSSERSANGGHQAADARGGLRSPSPLPAAWSSLGLAASAAAATNQAAAGSLDTAVTAAASAAATAVTTPEWVDAVVQEMMSAKDLDDARQRAGTVLQAFGAAAAKHACEGQLQEAQTLKEQLLGLQKDNHILKRAVAIQHERQLEHESRAAELDSLKQMLNQYQEQLRKLEVNNYALSLHLQKAQVTSTMPSRFHPDVF